MYLGAVPRQPPELLEPCRHPCHLRQLLRGVAAAAAAAALRRGAVAPQRMALLRLHEGLQLRRQLRQQRGVAAGGLLHQAPQRGGGVEQRARALLQPGLRQLVNPA